MAKKSFFERFFPKSAEKIRAGVVADANRVLNNLGEEVHRLKAAIPGVYASWTRSSGGKWNGGNATQLPGIVYNNWALRQQGRDIYEESPEAKAMITRFADTVVDSGLTVEPEPRADILGITQEEAQAWASTVREQFHLWASKKRQHRAGMFNFYQLQHLAQVYSDRDNDVLVRLFHDGIDKNLLNPLQFELLDTNQLRGDAITSTMLTGRFPDGIERNPDGSEKLYKIWVQNADETGYIYADVPKYGPSGKINILHWFHPAYAGQSRGLSGLGSTIQEFENLTDFKSANIMKAINQSNIVLFNKPSPKAPASNPFEQIGNAGAGPSTLIMGAPGTVSGASASAVTVNPGVNYTPVEEATLTSPGSTGVFSLDSGEELVAMPNTAPAVGYSEFVDNFCSYLCAMHGMPLEVLLMKFNANYSASRAALLLFWRVACMKRDFLADNLLDPTYESWLSLEIAMGRISAPGWSDPRLRAAWTAARWNGTPMPNIDPNSTAKADQLYIELGAQTMDDVARNLNGSSGKANRAKLKAEFAEMNGAGMVPWSNSGLGSPQMPGTNAPDVPQTPKKSPPGALK